MSLLRRLALIAAVTGTALLTPLAASAATSTWTVMPDQQNAQTNTLSAVSCPSVSFCLALGVNGPEPEAFQWNGSAWAASAPIGQADESILNGISCVSASYCLAVGGNYYHGSQAAAWLWNGSGWSGVPAYNPATKYNYLNAVKCVSTSYCEAVGSYSKYGGSGQHALAEVWNGTTWTGQPVGAKGAAPGVLKAVACASTSRCEAVGGGLAAGWNGTRWSVQKLPAVKAGDLDAVSCYRAGCTAVGTSSTGPGGIGTLAETWNGSRWALQSPAGSGNIKGADTTIWNAVHCGSASNCTVVGDWNTVNYNYALAETWNGSKWVQDTTPSPTSTDQLTALSCTPGTQVCTAVGWTGSTGLMLAERN